MLPGAGQGICLILHFETSFRIVVPKFGAVFKQKPQAMMKCIAILTETDADYPEWVEQLTNWKYLWAVELALLLLIVILVIIACRLYFQVKEVERLLNERKE